MKFIKEGYIKQQKKKKNIMIALSIIITIAVFFLITRYKKEQPDTGGDSIINQKKAEKTIPEIVSEVKQSIVLIHTFDEEDNLIGQGSGFFIEKGKIITNRHVLRGAHSVKIKSHSGEFYAIDVFADNRECDLMILSVPYDAGGSNPPPSNHSIPKEGQTIIVIGNPLGLEATVSDGIVSAHRELKPFGQVIQITSPISPGSSGSPVFNLYGEVIGVASFQIYQGQNLNFAIPISKIKELTIPENNDIASFNFAAAAFLESENGPFTKGLDLFEKKDYENALTYFKLALKQDPDNAEIYYYLGMCYKEENRIMAIAEFLNAVKFDPEYIDAYYMLGITHLELKDYQGASKYFEKVLKLNPEHQETLFQLGVICTILEKHKQALEHLQKISDVESNIRIKYYLGINFVKMKQYDQAEFMLIDVISQDPDFIPAHLGLGYVYLALKKWEDGISHLSNTLYLAPDNEEIHFILGLLHLGNHDPKSAVKELKELENINSASEFYSKLLQAIRNWRPRYLRPDRRIS